MSRLSRKPTLPGLMRYFASASAQAGWAAQQLVADIVEIADERHIHAHLARSLSRICGTAAAASSRSTVTRTSSEPACASAATCFTVASTSAVSVFVIDCTTMGAPPPTVTPPTFTGMVMCLASRMSVMDALQGRRIFRVYIEKNAGAR